MKVVIDSSILIDYLRGGTKWQDFLNKAPRDTELFLPTVVILELFSGKSTRKKSTEIDILNLFRQFTQIELTESIAIQAGKFIRDIGTHIDPEDYIIAASALEIGAKVFTLNQKHFSQIPGLLLFSADISYS